MGGVVALEKAGRGSKSEYKSMLLHPIERRFIEYMRRIGYASLEVNVQDGLPVSAERVTEKIKFTEDIDKNKCF